MSNIVLIGSTGHGKSTFGNWIHDFGQAKPSLFTVGNTPDPCTQNVVLKAVKVCADKPIGPNANPNAVTLNLIDTPGLNEENVDNDVKHMCELLQVVCELKYLSCVVLCIDFGFRRDSQVVSTLRYYQKLFQPVFSAGNVVIVLTKVDSSTYSSVGWSQAIDTRRAVISDILNFRVQNIFALSSCFPSRKINKCVDRSKGMIILPHKKNLLYASLIARLQFITLTSQLSPISMQGHLFPLPPCLEIMRISHLQLVNEKLKQLQVTLYTENKSSGEFIQQEGELQAETETIIVAIEEIEKQIREKKQIQRTAPQLIHDNNMFFRGKVQPLKFECPLDNFTVEEQKYNCTYKQHRPTPKSFEAQAQPDYFTLRAKEVPDETSVSARWYLRMQLAYSGEEHFKVELDRLKSEKIKLQEEQNKKQKRKEEVEGEHRKTRASIAGHQKHRQELELQKAIFIHTNFELERIPELLKQLV